MAQAQYFDNGMWRLVPGHTVHVVVDDQNDFLHPDGWYETHGISIAHMRRVIEPTKTLNAQCRASGVPIVWTRHGSRGIADGGPFMYKRPLLLEGGLRKDTWGYEILAELDPQPGDWFIEKTRQGGIANGGKLCSLYRFTDEAVLEFPKLGIKAARATNEWQNFTTVAGARAALAAAHAAAKRPQRNGTAALRKMNRVGSKNEWKASVTDSIPEAEAAALVHRVNTAKREQDRRKPA